MKFSAHPDRKWLAARGVIERSPYPTWNTRRVLGSHDRPFHQPHIGKKQIVRGLRQLGALGRAA